MIDTTPGRAGLPRNAEVIRQWTILRELEASRGATIRRLAETTGVTTRTIRRDLEALQEAGFPLYDVAGDVAKRWKLDTRPFSRLDDTAFTLAELSALYFSRTLVECFAVPPFGHDLRSAFAKLEAALGPRMRQFLDRLPDVIQAKAPPARRLDDRRQRDTIGRLLEALLHQRRLDMQYHSRSSRREKSYRIDPYRLVYAEGGLYLFAYVPRYEQVRTFAVERIRRLSPLDETFEPLEDIGDAVFPHSLGIHQGTPEEVKLEFAPELAPYVQERIWHPSQTVESREDGSVGVTMHVCNDGALRSWILSFGPGARVTAPETLARRIADDLAQAHARYSAREP
jgi:predicted DNA-binding transcriptional regulator YafY